jgi:hypothetical protein
MTYEMIPQTVAMRQSARKSIYAVRKPWLVCQAHPVYAGLLFHDSSTDYSYTQSKPRISGTHMATTSWVFVTFGEGCLNVLVFRAVRRLDHFSVISPINRLKSRGPIKHHHQK